MDNLKQYNLKYASLDTITIPRPQTVCNPMRCNEKVIANSIKQTVTLSRWRSV